MSDPTMNHEPRTSEPTRLRTAVEYVTAVREILAPNQTPIRMISWYA
jgi:hypothetical protein